MKATIITAAVLVAVGYGGFATGRATAPKEFVTVAAPEALIVDGHVVMDRDGAEVRNIKFVNGYVTATDLHGIKISGNLFDSTPDDRPGIKINGAD